MMMKRAASRSTITAAVVNNIQAGGSQQRRVTLMAVTASATRQHRHQQQKRVVLLSSVSRRALCSTHNHDVVLRRIPTAYEQQQQPHPLLGHQQRCLRPARPHQQQATRGIIHCSHRYRSLSSTTSSSSTPAPASQEQKNPFAVDNNNDDDDDTKWQDRFTVKPSQPFARETAIHPGQYDEARTNPLYRPKYTSRARIIAADDFAQRPTVGFNQEFASFGDAMVTLSWMNQREQKQIYDLYVQFITQQRDRYGTTSHEYIMRVIAQKFKITPERAAATVQLQHNEQRLRRTHPEMFDPPPSESSRRAAAAEAADTAVATPEEEGEDGVSETADATVDAAEAADGQKQKKKKQKQQYVGEDIADYMDAAIDNEIREAYRQMGMKKPDGFVEDPVGVWGVPELKAHAPVEDMYDMTEILDQMAVREDHDARVQIDGHVYVEDVDATDVSIPQSKDCHEMLAQHEILKSETEAKVKVDNAKAKLEAKIAQLEQRKKEKLEAAAQAAAEEAAKAAAEAEAEDGEEDEDTSSNETDGGETGGTTDDDAVDAADQQQQQPERRPRWKYVCQTVNVHDLHRDHAKHQSWTNNSPRNTLVECDGELREANFADIQKVSWRPVRHTQEHIYSGVKQGWLEFTRRGDQKAWGKAPSRTRTWDDSMNEAAAAAGGGGAAANQSTAAKPTPSEASIPTATPDPDTDVTAATLSTSTDAGTDDDGTSGSSTDDVVDTATDAVEGEATEEVTTTITGLDAEGQDDDGKTK